MSLLAELFEQLENGPKKSDKSTKKVNKSIPLVNVAKVAALAPAINDHQTGHDAPHTTAAASPIPTLAPAAERSAEARRNAWTITRGEKPVCTICGAPMTRAEALTEARWRWPDANIE